MVVQIVLAAIDPSNARRCRSRRREYTRQPSVLAASDRPAPARYARSPAERQRLLRDAENFGGGVSMSANPPDATAKTAAGAIFTADWERSVCHLDHAKRL